MKIENTSNPATGFVKATKSAAGSKVAASGGDEVQLSPLATQLQGADDASVFDAARVAEIKQAIADGRFTINADLIADRLIASAKELVDSRQA